MKLAHGTALFAIALFVGVGSVAVQGQDEPDLRREKRLHEIYKKYNEAPTSTEKWQQALTGAGDQSYQIENGDTLYDVSETFFGDPDFWPKLWAVNSSDIFNPHEITPGDKIEFSEGTLNEPPSFEVTDGKAPPPPKVTAGPAPQVGSKEPSLSEVLNRKKHIHVSVDLDLGGLAIPPPVFKNRRDAIALPQSVPKWFMRKSSDQRIVTELKRVMPTVPAAEANLLSYIQDQSLEAVGEIVEAEAGMTAAHENQYVVVRSKGAQRGQKYLIAREFGQLKDSGKLNDGTLVQIDGELQIQDPVNGEDSLYRALVTKAFAVIHVGTSIMNGDVMRYRLASGGAASEARAIVIGGPHSRERNIFGPGEVLFLDGGSGGGLSKDQVVNIFRVEKLRSEVSHENENPRQIGQVRILRSGEKFATGVVISAPEEIHVGDSTTRDLQIK